MKIRRILLYILVPIVILVGVGIVIADPSLRNGFVNLVQLQTVSDVQAYVHSLGIWGPIIVILLMILHSVTFVPSEVITITDVVLFGPVWGVVYAWVGSILGAYLAFFLARWFGRPLVNRFVPASSLRKFDQFMVDRGVSGIFILRLIPLVSFNALNYASGLTKLTLWQFTWTTGLGILPATILIGLLYRSAVGQRYAFIGLAIIGVMMLLGVIRRSRHTKK